jgi:hypothetical protein
VTELTGAAVTFDFRQATVTDYYAAALAVNCLPSHINGMHPFPCVSSAEAQPLALALARAFALPILLSVGSVPRMDIERSFWVRKCTTRIHHLGGNPSALQ